MIPPTPLIDDIQRILVDLLTKNPLATSSEAFVQNLIEFDLVNVQTIPRYLLRIGINYHGAKVQHLSADANNRLIGWNPAGDALATGDNAKMRLANHTIFPRNDNEHMLSDCKVGGGSIPTGQFVRIEFKVRGWLGKTKNLDGKQMHKDIDLLGSDRADLLVWCLSETAHEKWRGAGPAHQVQRRTGCADFLPLLQPIANITTTRQTFPVVTYRRTQPADPIEVASWAGIWTSPQQWTVSAIKITGDPNSLMPGADHYVTFIWRN